MFEFQVNIFITNPVCHLDLFQAVGDLHLLVPHLCPQKTETHRHMGLVHMCSM